MDFENCGEFTNFTVLCHKSNILNNYEYIAHTYHIAFREWQLFVFTRSSPEEAFSGKTGADISGVHPVSIHHSESTDTHPVAWWTACFRPNFNLIEETKNSFTKVYIFLEIN